MAINVGDAVLSFIADTTHLDQAVARLNVQLPSKVKPAADAVAQLGNEFTKTGQKGGLAFPPISEDAAALRLRIEQLEVEVAKLTVQLEAAGTRGGRAMRDAKGEVTLLGDAVGINLPRHVRTFIAELPGVASALDAAFSATAILFIVQALIQAGQKLGEFLALTYVYTEAQKASNDAILEQNKRIADLVQKTKDLANARELAAAKTPAERDAILLRQEAKDIGTVELAQKALNDALARATQLRAQLRNIPQDVDFAPAMKQAEKALDDVNKKIPDLVANLNRLKQAEGSLTEQGGRDALAEQIKAGTARIDAERVTGSALNELALQQGRLAIATLKVNFGQEAEIQRQFQEAQYQDTIKGIQDRIAMLARDPTRNVNELRALNARLEAEETQHEARQLKITVDFLEKRKAILAQSVETIQIAIPDQITTQQTQDVEKLLEAYKRLNIDGSLPLTIQLQQQQQAMDELSRGEAAGLVSSNDLLQARLKLVTIELALAKVRGQSTAALEKEHQRILQELGLLPRYGQAAKSAAEGVGHAIVATAFAFGQGAITISQAMRQIAGSIIQGIASIAEKKGIEQLAWAFGSWPDFVAMAHHFASAGLWFGLAGAVSAAAGAVSGGGPSSSSGGGGTNLGVTPGPSTTPEQQPIQVLNVQHLARGGLVSSETLALVHPREVVIPLDDSRAIGTMRELASQSGAAHIENHWHIDGVISADNLSKVVKRISRDVNTGRTRLNASNSLRVTKRG